MAQIPNNLGPRPQKVASLLLKEIGTDPPAPAANHVVLYAKDTGGGKTRLYARFASGGIQTVATEP